MWRVRNWRSPTRIQAPCEGVRCGCSSSVLMVQPSLVKVWSRRGAGGTPLTSHEPASSKPGVAAGAACVPAATLAAVPKSPSAPTVRNAARRPIALRLATLPPHRIVSCRPLPQPDDEPQRDQAGEDRRVDEWLAD